MAYFQGEACLDLIVRAINEVFNPIIETGDERREQSHDVDDLTNFYKNEENGDLVLNDESWNSANQFLNNPPDLPNDMVGSLFNQLRSSSLFRPNSNTFAPDHKDEDTNDNENVPVDKIESYNFPFANYRISEQDRFHEYEDTELPDYNQFREYVFHPKRNYYVPGKRPITDFLIKLLGWFQVTSDSKFITSRPRYKTFQYLLKTKNEY